MSKAARFFGIAVLFGILAVIFLLTVPSHPRYLLFVSLIVGAGGVAVALLDDRAAFISLGAALCILPLFGHGCLNLFVLGWLGGVYFLRALFGFPYASIDLSGSREIASWAFFLLLLPMLCAVGLTLSAEFDGLLLTRLLRSENLAAVFRYLATADVAWLRALNVAAGAICAGLLFFAVLSVSNVAQNFIHLAWGLAIGVVFACFFLVGQLLELTPFFFININPFWHFVGRYPASFSDPNSFGIMAMLILPVFITYAAGSEA